MARHRSGSRRRRRSPSRSRRRGTRRKRQREKSTSSLPKRDGKKDAKKKAKKAEKEKTEEKAENEKKEGEKGQETETGKAEKASEKASEKAEKPKEKPKEEKAKAKKKDAKAKGGDEKTNKSQNKKEPSGKTDAKKNDKKAKKEKGKSSSSYTYTSSSSSDEADEHQQHQQYLNAMNQWAMMQGMPTMGASGYPQYAGGQYSGYGAYGYSDPYRSYEAQGYGVNPPPPPPPGAPGGHAAYMPLSETDRVASERERARRRLEDETRQRNEELYRKADSERALNAVRNAITNLQNGQSDSLDHLQKTLETVVQRDLPKCEGQVEELKQDMAKAMAETAKRREALKELKGMVRTGEEHIKVTSEMIRQNLALTKEKDREEMNDMLENAGLEAQGMSDTYQSFLEERAASLEELQGVTKGPALVDLRLIIAKIRKLGGDLSETAQSAAGVVREGREKLVRREVAAEQTQRMKDTFQVFDADEDGYLSKQEVIQYCQGEHDFEPPKYCLERLWRNLVHPGSAGIPFKCFQQMKVTIGAARVIEKERIRKAQGAEATATLN